MNRDDIEAKWDECDRIGVSSKDAMVFFHWASRAYQSMGQEERKAFQEVVIDWLARGKPGYDPHRTDARYLIREWRLASAAPALLEESQRIRDEIGRAQANWSMGLRSTRHRVAVLTGEARMYEELAAKLAEGGSENSHDTH